MSNVEKLEADVEIKSPAHKFHEIMSRKPQYLINMVPEKFQRAELNEGEVAKEGTIIYWDYNENGVKMTSKEIVEEIDDVNMKIVCNMLEGDMLKYYKLLRWGCKVTPKGEGGVVRFTMQYERINPQIPHPTSTLEYVVQSIKDIDAQIASHL